MNDIRNSFGEDCPDEDFHASRRLLGLAINSLNSLMFFFPLPFVVFNLHSYVLFFFIDMFLKILPSRRRLRLILPFSLYIFTSGDRIMLLLFFE